MRGEEWIRSIKSDPKPTVLLAFYFRLRYLTPVCFFLITLIQVAEKILNNKELEFYKWDGDLSQLLQNVREKLNKVAEVFSCYPFEF